ncbi:MAG TPA: sigma-70 family RNA polymerase sigma factor [Gemmatimonadales bacterium]|nr:sigma-70 family RNA polymerase sigma factor [Gemmatimonadales bacterium]
MNLDAVFAEHRDAVCRYVTRYTGDADLAEDIVQEVFWRLSRRPFGAPTHVKGWLFRVATNLAKDARKVARRRQELALVARAESPAAAPLDPSELLERAELRRRIRSAVAGLSDKERTALLLREEGFAHHEIAAAVGTTTGSVGTLVARTLAKLAQRLELERGVMEGQGR